MQEQVAVGAFLIKDGRPVFDEESKALLVFYSKKDASTFQAGNGIKGQVSLIDSASHLLELAGDEMVYLDPISRISQGNESPLTISPALAAQIICEANNPYVCA